MMKQCFERAFLKGYNVNLRSASDTYPQSYDRATCREISAQLKLSRHHAEMSSQHQNATLTIGRGLSLFAENKLPAQDWGACVPSRPRALTKVKVKVKAKVKHMVGPIQGAHGGKSIG